MDEFAVVEHADNEAMAELIKQRLDAAGIPCLIASTGMSAVAGAGAAYAVSVPSGRVEAARELLGDA